MLCRSTARLVGAAVIGAITAGLIATYVHKAGAYRVLPRARPIRGWARLSRVKIGLAVR